MGMQVSFLSVQTVLHIAKFIEEKVARGGINLPSEQTQVIKKIGIKSKLVNLVHNKLRHF